MPITSDTATHVFECHKELVERILKFSEMPVSVPHKDFDPQRDCDYIEFEILNRRQNRFWFPIIRVYSNGYDSRTEGCVSVEFANFYVHNMAVNLHFVIAVIDAEGKMRFPRSYSERKEFSEFDYNPLTFRVDGYISRRVLLNEPSELIPDDTLSLHIDLDILIESSYVKNMLEACIEMGPDRRTFVLPLDSKLGKRLCQESKYFECLRTTPLMEENFRNKIIPIKENGIFGMKEHKGDSPEFLDFDAIHRILFCTVVKFLQIDDIFRLYTTADKYDIPLVVDFCRNCLELSLTPETAPEVMEFAEKFHDDRLRETAEKFHAADCRLQDETAFTVHSRATGMDYEWIFKRPKGYIQWTEVFYKESQESHDKVESDTYDFYR